MKLAIMLDPGHGNGDSGAATNGVLEKDINWAVVGEVKKMFVERAFSVELSRSESECPELSERAKRAKDWGADIVISVHHNAGGGTGYEIYKSVYGEFDDTLSEFLADEFKNSGQKPHGQGIYTKTLSNGQDYYGILRYCADYALPALITEYAYIDSSDVELVKGDGILKEAEAIARAVCRFCGVEWSNEPLEERIAQALVENGWSNSSEYWVKVMRGQEIAKGEYVKELLRKATGL